ncbi:MAG: hypothetical protein KJI71_01445 [Patescibacteria group bacterium]|nr:hypothetical protein [Patescibacteria group bacterium]
MTETSKKLKRVNYEKVNSRVKTILDSRNDDLEKSLSNEIDRINNNNQKLGIINDMEIFEGEIVDIKTNLRDIQLATVENQVAKGENYFVTVNGEIKEVTPHSVDTMFQVRNVSEAPASHSVYKAQTPDKYVRNGIPTQLDTLRVALDNPKMDTYNLRTHNNTVLGATGEHYPTKFKFALLVLAIIGQLTKNNVNYVIDEVNWDAKGTQSVDILFTDKSKEIPLVKNQIVAVGLRMKNDFLAKGTFVVQPFVKTVWCSNGAVSKDFKDCVEIRHQTENAFLGHCATLIQKALGKRFVGDELEVMKRINPMWSHIKSSYPTQYEEAFYDLLGRAIYSTVSDFGDEMFEAMEKSTQLQIADPAKEIDKLVGKYDTLSLEDGEVMKELCKVDVLFTADNPSQYDMAQLVTSIVPTVNYQKRIKLQEIGGDLFYKAPLIKIKA